jgi:hypothetical protein
LARYDFPNTHSATFSTFYKEKNPQLLWVADADPTVWAADTTSKIKRCSSYNCEKGGTHKVSYTSTVWFKDDDVYEYPYCKSDENYFDYTVLDDAATNYDTIVETCSLYEHRTPNYKQCEPNIPGFISPTAKDTPSETPVGNDKRYYSRMEGDKFADYTGITLKQCPQYTAI